MIQDIEKPNLPVPVEEQAKAIVPNDEIGQQIAVRLLSADDATLLDGTGNAEAVIAAEDREHAERTRMPRLVSRIGRAVMLRRIVERGARMLPSEEYRCQIDEPKKPPQKRVDILRALEGKVPATRLRDALWATIAIDARKADPQAIADLIEQYGGQPGFTVSYEGDATKLKALAKDFGGEVAAIVEKGIVYEKGEPRLIFEPIAKDVTPVRRAS